jgi:hypothetical protein
MARTIQYMVCGIDSGLERQYIRSTLPEASCSQQFERCSLDMTGYTYEATDIINVYINGLFGVAGTDFTLNTSGATPTVTTTATASGTVVTIDVMKSVIGFPALGTESLNTLTTESDVPIQA